MAETRVLFVVPYPQGQAASQRFRFEQYLPKLQQEGFLVEVASFWSSTSWRLLYQKGKTFPKLLGLMQGFLNRLLLLPHLHKYEFVFIHREATPIGPPWFEWLVAKVWRKKMIYDFDDAIWLPNTSAGNKAVARLKWHHKTADICRWSYKVSCGNRYLQQYALQFNTAAVLLPTTIDIREEHGREKQKLSQTIRIGWTGSHSTLPYLTLVEPVLHRLAQQHEFDFMVIADQDPYLQKVSYRYVPWKKETEVNDLLQFSIGIMPLPDTEWAKGKCAFKALQYMALGIPAVVSKIGANTEAVVDGYTGFCCDNEQEWYLRLEQLLVNAPLRVEMGAAGRAHVAEHYSVKANLKKFMGLFT
ncbi:glycosyltransferase family 4 protein [Pontibacter qinzhouensis]|uniref:Glycosyltransferase family 4 protein n=1 Tax=Pontibacter qinzhouensis TaxID=2603253 RepID=A0A5C8K7I4_9BACT|nr:glycosyltransferase [Pontibacter qinzhouensis]TXK47112.1 glycosyltransferase family 4 protein [Pontibacter qinzhouensis]